MSVGQDLVGTDFDYTQYSFGAISNANADQIVYTEVQPVPVPPQPLTINDLSLKIVSVSPDGTGGTTVLIAAPIISLYASTTESAGSSSAVVQAKVIGNSTNSILLEGNLGSGGTAINFVLLLTNNASSQPGVNGKISIPNQSANVVYVPPAPVCFAAGTRFQTVRGEVAVEDLLVGDHVLTASGAMRPIRWLGHRHISFQGQSCLAHTSPVRVAAHAFGADLPRRDLYLSPGHPVLVGADSNNVGGHLVPIMCLINGTNIARKLVKEVAYWHVELDQHDILLAENLPVESYIDLGSRSWFGGAEGALIDPDSALPSIPGRCRPVAFEGSVVDAARRLIDIAFATRVNLACAWPDEGDLLLL